MRGRVQGGNFHCAKVKDTETCACRCTRRRRQVPFDEWHERAAQRRQAASPTGAAGAPATATATAGACATPTTAAPAPCCAAAPPRDPVRAAPAAPRTRTSRSTAAGPASAAGAARPPATATATAGDVRAGAATAELTREQCCIDGRAAQKWWRICFGGKRSAWRIGDTPQQLCTAASRSDAGKRCVAESCAGAGAAAAELPLERCCVDARRAQKWWRICFGGKLGA